MITADQVKQLREQTGAGMMDCKRALQQAGGDMEAAIKALREQGLAAAERKSGRPTGQGLIEAYIHAGGKLGVLLEVNCETDFVAKTEDFQRLAHDLAMQVAAANPRWVRREDIDPDVIEREREILKGQALKENKPEKIIDKIVEGRLNKFYGEVCLMEQPFIRDDDLTIEDVVKEAVAKLGENITVRRFVRFALGEE